MNRKLTIINKGFVSKESGSISLSVIGYIAGNEEALNLQREWLRYKRHPVLHGKLKRQWKDCNYFPKLQLKKQRVALQKEQLS